MSRANLVTLSSVDIVIQLDLNCRLLRLFKAYYGAPIDKLYLDELIKESKILLDEFNRRVFLTRYSTDFIVYSNDKVIRQRPKLR